MRAGRRVRAETLGRGTLHPKVFIIVGLVALAFGAASAPATAHRQTTRTEHVVNGRIAYGFSAELDDTVVRTL